MLQQINFEVFNRFLLQLRIFGHNKKIHIILLIMLIRRLICPLCFAGLFFLIACGGENNSLESKKKALKEKRIQAEKLASEIKILEKEIAALDPVFAKQFSTATLVSSLRLQPASFTSFIEVQGAVKSDNNVILNAESAGLVKYIAVSEGQAVGMGQVLATQDNDVIQKQIAAVKTDLELADILFKRQENLWNQKVGTEVQYLQAKNNKERLEKQLQTLNAQLRSTSLIAPFSGIVDEIFIKKGQMALPGMQMMRLVNSNQVKVIADVSESHLNKIKTGMPVTIAFPSLNMEKDARISLIGQTINPDNRTFRVEVMMVNAEGQLKPDLLATLRIADQTRENAITIPANLIQRDKTGDYVYILTRQKDKLTAKKVRIKRGGTFKNQTLILEGLKGNEELIDEGFREVSDDSEVRLTEREKVKLVSGK